MDWAPVIKWFGYRFGFHDAEVVSIDLRRRPEPSRIRLHAWHMTSEIDEKGYFRLERHALVTFTLTDIVEQFLEEWNHQNVLMGLVITEVPEGLRMELDSTFGVGGHFIARNISVSVEAWHSP